MNTKVLINLGNKIKFYGLKSELTQEKLAEKMGFHQTYTGKLETKKINASVKTLFVISRALNIKLSDIFSFD